MFTLIISIKSLLFNFPPTIYLYKTDTLLAQNNIIEALIKVKKFKHISHI